MANATFFLDPTTVTAREAEVPNADFAGGCNRGGSNAPGVGINIGGGDVTNDWTIPDQHGVARNPQDSQHLGNGNNAGVEGPGTVPINATDNVAEFNDTVSLTVLATGWVQNPIA